LEGNNLEAEASLAVMARQVKAEWLPYDQAAMVGLTSRVCPLRPSPECIFNLVEASRCAAAGVGCTGPRSPLKILKLNRFLVNNS
jgi:hypothetical protein